MVEEEFLELLEWPRHEMVKGSMVSTSSERRSGHGLESKRWQELENGGLCGHREKCRFSDALESLWSVLKRGGGDVTDPICIKSQALCWLLRVEGMESHEIAKRRISQESGPGRVPGTPDSPSLSSQLSVLQMPESISGSPNPDNSSSRAQ